MSLIYEDEILPEIDIRELLTLEQALEENPSFVAFTKNEMIEHLWDLLPQSNNVVTIADTILDTINAPPSDQQRKTNVVPVLKASYGFFENDMNAYAAKLRDMKNAPNYKAQQELLDRLAYLPLDRNADSVQLPTLVLCTWPCATQDTYRSFCHPMEWMRPSLARRT
jgi:hypothetical protein